MRHLSRDWERLKGKLSSRRLYLFLDYDGTLSPLRRTPGEAETPPAVRAALRSLARRQGVSLALISGRMLRDVKKRIGMNGVVYSGNHGLEIEGPGLSFGGIVPAGTREVLREIKKALCRRLAGIEGAFVEDKELTLSLHYRLVARRDLRRVTEAFAEVTRPYLREGRITVNTGKKVFEMRPPVRWDKGRAVRWILEQKEAGGDRYLPLYMGDDLPDEAGFRAVARRGIGILVGRPRSSRAAYYLHDPAEAAEFLMRIAELRK